MELLCQYVWMIILSMAPNTLWSYCRRVSKLFLVLSPSTQVPTHKELLWSIHHNKIECLKLLLQDPRVDPSDDDNYAIRWTSYNGHTECVRLLLQDPRVDPSARANDAIQGASENGHTECVRLLRAHSTETVPSNK